TEVPDRAHFTAAPEAAIAVLVRGHVFEHGFNDCAASVGRVCARNMHVAGYTEGVVGVDVAVEHEAVVGRVGDIAFEYAHWNVTRPGGQAGLRAFECAV